MWWYSDNYNKPNAFGFEGLSLLIKHLTADSGIVSSIPSHTNRNTKRIICTGSFLEKCSHVWATNINLQSVCSGAVLECPSASFNAQPHPYAEKPIIFYGTTDEPRYIPIHQQTLTRHTWINTGEKSVYIYNYYIIAYKLWTGLSTFRQVSKHWRSTHRCRCWNKKWTLWCFIDLKPNSFI